MYASLLLTNIGLGLKFLTWKNTLAYFNEELIAAVKSFLELASQDLCEMAPHKNKHIKSSHGHFLLKNLRQ
jgi:hypothetical protein